MLAARTLPPTFWQEDQHPLPAEPASPQAPSSTTWPEPPGPTAGSGCPAPQEQRHSHQLRPSFPPAPCNTLNSQLLNEQSWFSSPFPGLSQPLRGWEPPSGLAVESCCGQEPGSPALLGFFLLLRQQGESGDAGPDPSLSWAGRGLAQRKRPAAPLPPLRGAEGPAGAAAARQGAGSCPAPLCSARGCSRWTHTH